MAYPKGKKMKQREVACVQCGVTILRATHFRQARCSRCRTRAHKQMVSQDLKTLREQARRYRILCHVLGWEPEQFAEMLEHAKASPLSFRRDPESRSARYDLALERRSTRRSA